MSEAAKAAKAAGAGAGRLARHRAERARFGLRGWAWRNLAWWLAERVGVRIVRVGITWLDGAADPGGGTRLWHGLVDEAGLLAHADTPGMARPADELRVRFARGDWCFASFDGTALVAFNWYSRGVSPVARGVLARLPAQLVVSHDTVVAPAWRGRGVAAESWRVSHAALAGRGVAGILVFVDAHNLASMRALAKDARLEWVGLAVLLGRGRVRRAWASAGCRRQGVAMVVDGGAG